MFIGGDKFQDILMNEVPNKVDPPSKFIFRNIIRLKQIQPFIL